MTDRKLILDAELASLADGSLPPQRRREIEDQINESAAARESIARQRRAVEIVRGAEADAPHSLHAAVADMLEPRTARRPARGAGWAFAGVAAGLAVAVFAAALVFGGGTRPVDAAAQLAAAGPALPAPHESSADSKWLNAKVADVAFPYWEDDRGWKAYGARNDKFGARTAKTVYYRDARGRSVAYTIVGGAALPDDGGTLHADGAVSFRTSDSGGTSRVVWRRGGHTCIITARGVPSSELQTLVD